MSKRLLLLTAFLVAFATLASTGWAQSRTVTGTVTSSEDGQPLPGASVVLKGTSTGTATDVNGQYELSVPQDGGVLRVSFVGYVAREVPIEGRSEIDVELTPDYQELSEVVVVGYGSQIQKDVTGNISRVAAEDIENSPVTSIEETLQGKAAGVFIENSSGKLGQGINVQIRGVTSISADNQPLFVVDGIPVTTTDLSSNGAPTNPLADLNFNDIQSVEILKDAAAAAIYGARASNGVVLITTKSGSSGDTQFSVNYQISSSEPTNKVDFLNAQQYVDFYMEAARNGGRYDYNQFPEDWASEQQAINAYVADMEDALDFFALGTDWRNQVIDEDWQDNAFQEAYGMQLDVSASGGNESTRFYISGSYNDQQGILFRDDFRRITGRINLDHQFSDWLRVGGKLSLGQTINRQKACRPTTTGI